MPRVQFAMAAGRGPCPLSRKPISYLSDILLKFRGSQPWTALAALVSSGSTMSKETTSDLMSLSVSPKLRAALIADAKPAQTPKTEVTTLADVHAGNKDDTNGSPQFKVPPPLSSLTSIKGKKKVSFETTRQRHNAQRGDCSTTTSDESAVPGCSGSSGLRKNAGDETTTAMIPFSQDFYGQVHNFKTVTYELKINAVNLMVCRAMEEKSEVIFLNMIFSDEQNSDKRPKLYAISLDTKKVMNLTPGDILKIQGYDAPGVVDLDEHENVQTRRDDTESGGGNGCRGGGGDGEGIEGSGNKNEGGEKIADEDKIIVEERPRRLTASYQSRVTIKKPKKRSNNSASNSSILTKKNC